MACLRATALLLAVLLTSAPPLAAASDRPDAPEPASERASRSLARGARDMVAAAHPLAVDAAAAVLARGGSALDAAIAASFTARDGLRATWAYRALVARNLALEFIEEQKEVA